MGTIVTESGRGLITALLAASSANHIGWGTGAGTSALADTDLFTPGFESRVAGTQSQETIGSANDTYQVVGTIVAADNRTVTNAGVFDDPTAGNMLVKGDFTPIALGAGESIQFTIQVQLA